MTTSLVFDETSTYINTPCPPWCQLSMLHPVDNLDGADGDFRIHGDVSFGAILYGFAEEYVKAPGVLVVKVALRDGSAVVPAGELRQLAADALAAAEWLDGVKSAFFRPLG